MKVNYSATLTALAVAALFTLASCSQKTPEERLARVGEAMQQRDTLSAELEAKKIIEKHPDDPAAIQARLMLAQIYMQDQRIDEALAEIETILDKVPQSEQLGKNLLAQYIQILEQQGRGDDAIKVIDKFQQANANDRITSEGLNVLKASVLSNKGETTVARSMLFDIVAKTTVPLELNVYREMIANTYQQEGNTTAALELYEKALVEATDDGQRRELYGRLAWRAAEANDYDAARKYAEEATTLFRKAIADEIDANNKARLAHELAMIYTNIGNLEGAETIFRQLYDGAVPEDVMESTIKELSQNLMRQARTSDTVTLLRSAAARYPQTQLLAVAQRIEEMTASAPDDVRRDTSTLVLRFEGDPLLSPGDLGIEKAPTTGTISLNQGTTDSVPAAVQGEGDTTGNDVPTSAVASTDAQTTISQ